MATQGDKLSPIFKSLQPNKAQFEATNTAAVQEAEQRWPLFKAVAPVKPSTPPALSEEDRQHWRNTENVENETSRPTLSVPGLSDKLAQSLGKMGGEKSSGRRAAPKTAKAEKIDKEVKSRNPIPKVAPTPLVSDQPINNMAPITKPATVSVSKHSELAPTASANPIPVVKSVEPLTPGNANLNSYSIATAEEVRATVSSKVASTSLEKISHTLMAKPAMPTGDTPIRANESLKSLFGRLENPEQPKVKSGIKTKTSFLGRLGKR